jgi:mono/diheme cytochrome c family protein
MPKFTLTDEETKELVIFLKSRRGFNYAETTLDRYRSTLAKKGTTSTPAGDAVPQSPTGGDPIKIGEQLVNERACAACHKIGNVDGGIAPDLTFQGLLKDEKWLVAHFKDPRSLVPDSIMPTFAFPESDFKAMSAYLMTLNKVPAFNSNQEIYQGLCMRCHGDKGDGHGMIATYLDPYPRDFTNVGFMNSKPEERFVDSVKNGVGGTSMPAWGKVLNDQQIKGVLSYINEAFTKDARGTIPTRDVPEQNPVATSAESVARGEAIYQQRCTGCHGRKADGKGANALDILPRPRNLLNWDFVNKASDRRLFEAILYGVQGTAMPPWIDYGLSKEDVGDIVNYIRSLNQGKKDALAMNLATGH